MYQKVIHNNMLRIVVGVLGSLLLACAINLFIVPQHLYTGGLYGLCQVIRTVLVEKAGWVVTSFDLAGLFYLSVNIPLLVLAYRSLGRPFVIRLIICTLTNSLFLTIIPSPTTPIITDTLTSCLVGGIISGFANGLVLTCGCSCGGLDILGLYLSKKGSSFTVGKFSISFNAVLYLICGLLFSVNTAIYSAICTVFSALFLDRAHQQNIAVQLLIFTKDKEHEIAQFIMDELERGATYWSGKGGYTGDDLKVLCVCMSKYEVATAQQKARQIDPDAFFVVQEGVRVSSNFERHLF